MSPSPRVIRRTSKEFKALACLEAKKIGKYFNILPPEFELRIAKTRKTFNRILSLASSEPWLVGMLEAGNTPTIVLLSPNVIAREGIHKSQDIERILEHELVHLVFRQLYPLSKPIWLKEGLAVYFSGQYKKAGFNQKFFSQQRNFPLSLVTGKQWEESRKFGAYGISGKFIEFLVEEFGQRRINFLIKRLPKDRYNESIFLQQFNEVYKSPVRVIGKRFLKNLGMKGGEKK